MILLSAVEAGYGEHYSHNRVFFADPATGKILKDKTLTLDDHYWFPAMTLYPDFEAPVIDIKSGEETHFDIYNLQGIRVKTDATIQDINNLPPGIYIAGGKKYIVR